MPPRFPHSDDYFSIVPPSYSHFSTETPSCSPTFYDGEAFPYAQHPLLSSRQTPTTRLEDFDLPSASTNFMAVQTSAAHGHPARPRPQPVQNVLHVTSDDSSGSDSSASASGYDSPQIARCSRCQRTQSLDVATGKNNMIKYGLNLWYCTRCAGMVGLPNR